jgi:hypothetical protein
MKKLLSILVNLMLLVSLLAPASVYAAPPPPTPVAPAETSQEQAVDQAVQAAVNAHRTDTMYTLIYGIKVEHIAFNAAQDTATAWVVPVDESTGKDVPTEPAIVVVHLGSDRQTWNVSLPTSPDYAAAIGTLPDSMMPKDERDLLITEAKTITPMSTTAYGGFYLPWKGGDSKYLVGSIAHSLGVIPPYQGKSCPNTCLYAFDFSDGTMFPLLAARSGNVWAFKDTTPNNSVGTPPYYQDCDLYANYLIIEDTTSTPPLYAVYYHMAQGSIPANLKQIGAYVSRGDYIGRVDNTGCSSGSHLHFQAFTSPNSAHWGLSVDITFNDVDINGGRPRTCAEAQTFPKYGSQCHSNGYFTSGNRAPTPPTGTLTAPAAWSVVNGSTLTVSGSGTDDYGVEALQVAFDYDGTWKAIGDQIIPPTNPWSKTYPVNVTLDLCAAGVPDGPLTVGLWVWDNEDTRSLTAQSARPIVKNYACQQPPPPCNPTLNQVALFSLPDYQGACEIYNFDGGLNSSGIYDTASLGAIGDNTAASIEVGANVMATVYDQDYTNGAFAGRAETFDASDPGLEDNRIGVGHISSLHVMPLAPPAAPTLNTPRDTTTYPLNGVDSFLLTWDAGGGGVDFQVALTHPDATQVTSPWLKSSAWSVGSTSPGNYTWTVTARNRAGQVTSTPGAFTVAPGYLGEAPVTFPYGDNMSNGINHWTATGLWRQTYDSTDGLTPHNTFWAANKSAGGANPADGTYASSTIFASDLTSPPIAIPAGSTAYLRFREYAHTESPGPYWDQRLVQISVNAGPFTDLYQFQDDPTDWWVYSPFLNLSAFAGMTVRIRFHFDQVDATDNGTLGWRIDDVALNTTAPDVSKAEAVPNDSTAKATPLAMDSSTNAYICPAGDLDYYSFIVDAGETVNFNIDAQGLTPPSSLDTYIFLIDSDGRSVIVENDDEVLWVIRDSNLTYTFHRAGTYYLKVKSWSFPGSSYLTYTCSNFFYTLRVYGSQFPPEVTLTTPYLPWIGAVPTDISAQVLASPGGLASVEFLWHSPDWANGTWTPLTNVTATGATTWKATLDPTGKVIPGSALVVRATDRTGLTDSVWIANLTSDNTPPTTLLLGPATHTLSTVIPLQWTASDNASGLRSLEIEYKDLTAGGDWQPWNVTLPGYAHQAFFLGVPGHTYAFNIRGIDNAGNVEAYPSTPEIQTDIANTCTPDPLDRTSPYDNSAANAQPLALKSPQIHNFCPSGDQDWVAFTLPAGGSYRVQVQPASSGAAMRIAITSADGSKILLQKQSTALGEGLDFRFIAPAGNYKMQISPLTTSLWGTNMTYSVQVGSGNWDYVPIVDK